MCLLYGAAAFDPELHSVLEMASDAELTELSNILYGQRLISFCSMTMSVHLGVWKSCNG